MSFLSQPITLQSLFGKNRKIGDITVNVVIDENTVDVLTITKQPVQEGASITDHAYKEPTVLSMTAYFKDNSLISGILNTFSGNGLPKIYQDLLKLQASRKPFDVVTVKRIYNNMLMASLSVTTDKATENCLAVRMTFQQINIVQIATTTVPRLNQRSPGRTGGTQPAGKKQSGIVILSQGVQSVIGR